MDVEIEAAGVEEHPFLSLPGVAMQRILSYLPETELKQLRLVNKRLWTSVDEIVLKIRLTSLSRGQRMTALHHLIKNWHRWPALEELDATQPFSDAYDDNGAHAFFASLYSPFNGLETAAWVDLEYLNLTSCGLGPMGVAALARGAQHWRKLRVLNLARNQINSRSLALLAEVDLPCLDELDLTDNNLLGEGGGAALAAAAAAAAMHWPSLRKLNLSETRLFDKDLSFFLESTFPHLQELNLTGNHLLLTQDVAFSRAAVQWPNLRVLDLRCTELDSFGADQLAHTPFIHLEEFSYGGDCDLIFLADAVRALKNGAESWPRLRCFRLGGYLLEDQRYGIFDIPWNNLEYLAIHGNVLNVVFAGELASAVQHGRLPSLKRLDLSDSHLDDDIIDELFSSPWPMLEELYMNGFENGPPFDDASSMPIDAFASNSEKLRGLRIVSLRYCDISVRSLRRLLVAFPFLEKLDVSHSEEEIYVSGVMMGQGRSNAMLSFS